MQKSGEEQQERFPGGCAGFLSSHSFSPNGGVEQRLARVAHNHDVTGSSPVTATSALLKCIVFYLPQRHPAVVGCFCVTDGGLYVYRGRDTQTDRRRQDGCVLQRLVLADSGAPDHQGVSRRVPAMQSRVPAHTGDTCASCVTPAGAP